jgi:hypothetical protein
MPAFIADHYPTDSTYTTAAKKAALASVTRSERTPSSTERKTELLDKFLDAYQELQAYK